MISFFRPGGTMDPNAPSYVERQSDRELLQALLDREYVFLLDSRQKGKSSLIARTMLRLREHGVRPVKLDLQRIGANLTPEQWYAGLLNEIGIELGVAGEVFEVWGQMQHVGPLARCVHALGIALAPIAAPIVIFVDEIDFVRALPFSADEFFAAIRDCYNRRSESAVYGRLTFCLAGVATPSQLIQNPEITPFNIGRRIELADFTEDELRPFAQALVEAELPGETLLSRVHHWLDGHPYLTQLLCAAALETGAKSVSDIDKLVAARMTTAEQRQRDPNLADVERRMLEPYAPGFNPEDARSRVLEIHRRLLKKQHVGVDYEDPMIATLLLAGVAKDREGRLVLRNRVYEQVFNERWRRASMPDAEKRRQRAAFRRGALRVGVVAGVILVVVGSLTVKLAVLAGERDDALQAAMMEADKAERAVYVRTMALMETEARDSHWTRVRELFDDVENSRYRGWEFGHWFQQLNGHDRVVRLEEAIMQLGVRADGALVVRHQNGLHVLDPDLTVTGTFEANGVNIALSNDASHAAIQPAGEPSVRVVDSTTFREISTFDKANIITMPYLMEPDSRRLTGQLYKLERGRIRPLEVFTLPEDYLHTRVSPSGRYLLLIRSGGAVLIDRVSSKRVEFVDNFYSQINAHCFDRSESRVWIAASANFVKELSLPSGKETRRFAGYQAGVRSLQLNATEEFLLTGSADGTVVISDLRSGKRLQTLQVHGGAVHAAWGNDTTTVFTGSASGELRRYNLARPSPIWVLPTHQGQVGRSVFTSDSRRLITLSEDGSCRLYDVQKRSLIKSIKLPGAPPPGYIKLSKNEHVAFAGGKNGEVVCFETNTGKECWRSPGLGGHVTSLVIAPDEATLLVGTYRGLLVKLDALTGAVLIQRSLGESALRGCTFLPGGKEVAVGRVRDVHFIRADTFAATRHVAGGPSDGDVRSMSLSGDGTRLLVTRTVVSAEYRLDNLDVLKTFAGHTDRVFSARYSASENLVYTIGRDGRARVMDRVTGRLTFEARHDSWVSAAEMTNDEERLITSSDDGTVRLWSTVTGDQVATLPGNGSTVFNVALSKDESMIATSAQDGRVVVYFGLPRDQLRTD